MTTSLFEKALEVGVKRLDSVLESLMQSPLDYSSDGFYDFFFAADSSYQEEVEIEEGDKVVLTPKLHLCIHVDGDTGTVYHYVNAIRADKEHEVIQDYEAHAPSSDFWEAQQAQVKSLLENLREQTGIVFDLVPTVRNPDGRVYSSKNVASLGLMEHPGHD